MEKRMKLLKIKNERGVITNDLTEIKTIIRKYQEQQYANELDDNLDEMHIFLKRHKLPTLTQKEIMNWLITTRDTEVGILKPSTKKAQAQMAPLVYSPGCLNKTTNGYVVSLRGGGGDENVLELDCGHGSPYFEICELYLNYIKSKGKSRSHLAQL